MESRFSWLVLAIVCITNILTIGFVFGTVGVFVQFYNHKFSADQQKLTGWIGSTASATLLIFCVYYKIINIIMFLYRFKYFIRSLAAFLAFGNCLNILSL